jgi:hypothetical protein
VTRTLSLPALEVRQGQHTLYNFAVDGKQLHQFITISRIKRSDAGSVLGYQRPEILQHVRQIREYLETADPLLPNALVVAFDERVRFTPSARGTAYCRAGTLAIPIGGSDVDKVGWLVDGQQRAAALREANTGAFPVCVVGFVARSVQQQRDQFLLVNSTKPLPRGLLYELLPETGALVPEALRKYRLPSVLLELLRRSVMAAAPRGPCPPILAVANGDAVTLQAVGHDVGLSLRAPSTPGSPGQLAFPGELLARVEGTADTPVTLELLGPDSGRLL